MNLDNNAEVANIGSFKLSFNNVNYYAGRKSPFARCEPKNILDGISGEFRGAEMTAIIGLSGSGKTSLLNVLSGFRKDNVSGSFMINDIEMSIDCIRQISSYFMQEQALHLYLTVSEIMMFSLSMKKKLKSDEKMKRMEILLEKLTITHRKNTFIKDLSGGERKRLQIAIELVSEPNILFLDEPTTNLDSVASLQCIQFLKSLTREGTTIICTIHQPSATIFKIFDHIYAMASGRCIYQGSSMNLIRFLDELDLACPSTYNPADFLLEIANNDYGDHNRLLEEKILNGSCISYRNNQTSLNENSIDIFDKARQNAQYSASYFVQVYYLMWRIFLTVTRSRTLLLMRFGLHLIIGISFGFIYKDIGKKGSLSLDNYRFCIISVCFLLYTSYHSLYALFPLEFPIIKREFFNSWYSSRAYFTAIILFDAPIIFICCIIYTSITFVLTDQPLEKDRYLLFLGFCLLMSYAGQSLGIMFTSLMNIQATTTFGTIIMMPFFLFSSFVIFAKDTHPVLTYIFDANFLNMAFKGSVNSLLGLNRTKLECDILYCHYSDPKKILRDFEMSVDLSQAAIIILIYYVLALMFSFLLINYRLKYRHE